MWVFDFEKAQDIISTLKIQFSYLFKDALKIKTKIESDKTGIFDLNLSSKALSILLEKSDFYEFEFFTQTMVDEILKKENLKNDYHYNIFLETKHRISKDIEFTDWVSYRMGGILNLVASLNSLISNAYPKFIAELGTPSDLKGLFYISVTYARIFENVINWAIETQSSIVPDDCVKIKDAVARLSSNLIEQIWAFPFEFRKSIEEEKIKLISGATNETIKISLTIGMNNDDLDRFYTELDVYKKKKGIL